MTYCVAIAVDSGLVFASDSRTNAGVDNVNSYPKMFRFQIPGKAYFVLLTSGNLATTRPLSIVSGGIWRQMTPDVYSPADCKDMADAARYIGALSVELTTYYSKDLGQGANFDATLLLGGQVKGHLPEIFLIYPQGNYIKSSPTRLSADW